MVNSKLLYAAPVWTSALKNHAIQKKLFSAQRGVVLRIVSAYRTMSTTALLALASVPQIGLLAGERKGTFQLRKKLTCLTEVMAWWPIREMETPSNPRARYLAQ